MYDTYIVENNDTIGSIASKFNISPKLLTELNGNKIIPGKTILIPNTIQEYFDYYTVNKGDTLYKIAEYFNVDANLLAQLNGINKTDYIYPNQVLIIPKSGSILYITAIGDTLKEVANGLNTTTDKLIEQNSNIYLQPEQLIVYKYK